MTYMVTFCATDQEAESNLMWHSCILLSQINEQNQLEVVDTWGFYGLPSTASNTVGMVVKKTVGLDIDLCGNHAWLRHEDVRFLDRGTGLHGVSFELTKEQFDLLQNKCAKTVEEQEQAVEEMAGCLNLQPKDLAKTRIYPYEDSSLDIFAAEKAQARVEGRVSRLKSFELQVSWSMWGPHLRQASTCKSLLIETLLSHVLTKEQINRITEQGKHPSVPRFSGPMETLYLHSRGPLCAHTKHSGEVIRYRDREKKPGVRLIWTVLPQNLDATEETKNLFKFSYNYRDGVKKTVKKLQGLEWLILNAVLPTEYEDFRQQLLHKIIEYYSNFSFITAKTPAAELSDMNLFRFKLWFAPPTAEEQILREKMGKAEGLFHSLHAAIIEERVDILHPETALAAYLPQEAQIKICDLLGYVYEDPKDLYAPLSGVC